MLKSLSIREPTRTSVARALRFDKKNVGKFCNHLDTPFQMHNYPSNRIWMYMKQNSLLRLSKLLRTGSDFIPTIVIFRRKI